MREKKLPNLRHVFLTALFFFLIFFSSRFRPICPGNLIFLILQTDCTQRAFLPSNAQHQTAEGTLDIFANAPNFHSPTNYTTSHKFHYIPQISPHSTNSHHPKHSKKRCRPQSRDLSTSQAHFPVLKDHLLLISKMFPYHFRTVSRKVHLYRTWRRKHHHPVTESRSELVKFVVNNDNDDIRGRHAGRGAHATAGTAQTRGLGR